MLFFDIFFPKKKLSRGDGGSFIIFVENPEGWGVTVFLKNGKSGEVLSELPSIVGVWIFSGTTQFVSIVLLKGHYHGDFGAFFVKTDLVSSQNFTEK